MNQQYPPPNPPPASGPPPALGATLTTTIGATPAPTTGATPAPTTGTTPGPQTLTSVAPPDYGDIYKQQQQPPPQQPAQGFPVQSQGFPVQPQFPIQPQFAYKQQPAMQPAIQPLQYMMPASMQMVAVTRPNYPGPHDFLFFALTVTIVCAFLNLTSLVFGITAIVLAITSRHRKHSAMVSYSSAKKYATAALALTICDIVYTLVFAIFSIGISVGLFSDSYSSCSRFPIARYCLGY